MYLIDTNILSEARKGVRANAGVRDFFEKQDSQHLFLSVLTVGEIRRGLEHIRCRGDLAQALRLETWLDDLVVEFDDHILTFDMACAQVWGKLMSPNAQHAIDKQIAATALIFDLTVVTRNLADFQSTGARLINPFR
ncbi:MAG TPA: type II toxin-antitoxin system VapC family toxin [Burkholderiaceae bacterium]|nr:type II toxin-antitoxin system VapC family toxin [Burkholderiaceae bacterium]